MITDEGGNLLRTPLTDLAKTSDTMGAAKDPSAQVVSTHASVQLPGPGFFLVGTQRMDPLLGIKRSLKSLLGTILAKIKAESFDSRIFLVKIMVGRMLVTVVTDEVRSVMVVLLAMTSGNIAAHVSETVDLGAFTLATEVRRSLDVGGVDAIVGGVRKPAAVAESGGYAVIEGLIPFIDGHGGCNTFLHRDAVGGDFSTGEGEGVQREHDHARTISMTGNRETIGA